ncbi:Receptor expression-enhancing protein [Paragonimus heterotremus]|uniref:Receptor expression-enhancing protein n=1 Tax=Paragonimus heterotremus TaxID=100268 RepID=A0A8J4WKR5_9TREM|nr:Receptor expression-enhancing protein [Paragonimus heterotremus]
MDCDGDYVEVKIIYRILVLALTEAAIMDRINNARNRLSDYLHRKNAVNDLLAKVEKKTKIDRVNLVLGIIVVFFLYLIFGYGSSFLATFVGFVYPAYRSIKALETLDKKDDTKWLTYWCVMFLFLMSPTDPNGSMLIYERIIRPYVLKHEKDIDDAVNTAVDLAGDFSEGVKKKATEAAVSHFSNKED